MILTCVGRNNFNETTNLNDSDLITLRRSSFICKNQVQPKIDVLWRQSQHVIGYIKDDEASKLIPEMDTGRLYLKNTRISDQKFNQHDT